MDSWPFRRWLSRHILPVGITCRCYPTPRTRETIHSSYQPTPRTRSNLPSALPGSDSRFVSHRYAQAVAASMAAVGGAALPFGGQPAAQARQARPGHLCGRSHALPAGSGRPGSDRGASLTSEAPWGVVSATARLVCGTLWESVDGPKCSEPNLSTGRTDSNTKNQVLSLIFSRSLPKGVRIVNVDRAHANVDSHVNAAPSTLTWMQR